MEEKISNYEYNRAIVISIIHLMDTGQPITFKNISTLSEIPEYTLKNDFENVYRIAKLLDDYVE